MTASVSCSSPSGPHMWPRGADHGRHRGVDDDVAGHVQVGDAAVGVDHGQLRAVGQPLLDRRLDLGAVRQRVEAGQDAAEAVVRAEPGGGQGRRRTWSKTSGRNAWTTWPKMIGSETFIIVALRWTENSTSSALARAICAARNSSSAATCIAVASTTSPAQHRDRLAQHRGGAVLADQLDPQRAVGLDHGRRLVGAEVVGASCARRWSWSPATRRPSSAGGSGRTA